MILHGDCLDVLPTLEADSIEACVTDPPYGLEFMGVGWDTLRPGGNPRVQDTFDVLHSQEHPRHPSEQARIRRKKNLGAYEFHAKWAVEVLRVLKPGGHLLAFGGTRTYHRLACAIEDAGFEVRDCLMWIYGSGFPKSLNVGLALDKAAGAVGHRGTAFRTAGAGDRVDIQNANGKAGMAYVDPITDLARQWSGWGTALKPAYEPILLARKPLAGTVAQTVARYGTGAINIDGCRVATEEIAELGTPSWGGPMKRLSGAPGQEGRLVPRNAPKNLGRWPANVLHDGSDEVVGAFPQALSAGRYKNPNELKEIGLRGGDWSQHLFKCEANKKRDNSYAGDSGSAARFFKECQWTANDVSTAATSFDQPSASDDSAHGDAVTWAPHGATSNPASPVTADSTGDSSACIPSPNPANAGPLGDIGTIETTQSPLTSCGCAPRATEGNIRSENGAIVGNISSDAPRFIYQPKASRAERERGLEDFEAKVRSNGNKWTDQDYRVARGERPPSAESGPRRNHHPTVKPLALMRYLVRLVTPPGGTVLDPFAGSGSTLVAAVEEGFNGLGIEQDAEYVKLATARLRASAPLFSHLTTP